MWAWGVDVNASSAAFGALLDEPHAGVSKLSAYTWKISSEGGRPDLVGAQRLTALRWALEKHRVVREYLPTVIVVEYPINSQGGSLAMMTALGVVMQHCDEVYGCPIIELPVPTWKSRAGIGGHADKQTVRRRALELGLADAASEDEADALVIADVARQLLPRGN